MIQRIQSIFLLLASGSLGGTFALPLADSSAPSVNTFFADSLFTLMDSMPLMVIIGLAALLAFAAIFLFNNRNLQKNVVLGSALLTIAGVGYGIGVLFSQIEKLSTGITIDEEPGAFLPVLGFIFTVLAIRYINKDEKLVRSADRLR